MYKKLLFIGLFVLLSSAVLALDSSDARIKHWYKMDEASGNMDDEKVPGAYLTERGTLDYQQKGFAPGSDYCIHADAGEGFHAQGSAGTNYTWSTNKAFMIWFWVNTTTSGDGLFYTNKDGGYENRPIYWMYQADYTPYINVYNDGGTFLQRIDGGAKLTIGAVTSIAVSWNKTHLIYIVNGSKTFAASMTSQPGHDGSQLQVPWSTAYNLDDWAIFERTDTNAGDVFTAAELTDLWENWLEDADNAVPTFSSNTTNETATAPKKNDVLQFEITVGDNTDVDVVTLAHNMSGTLTNVTNITYSGTGDTSVTVYFNETVTIGRGGILWQVWANDSSNNMNSSAQFTATVKNSAPNTPTVSFPVDGRAYMNITAINFSASEPDGDSITYYIYINDTLNTTTSTNITQWNATDGYYQLKISAYDGTDFSSNTTVNFRLDSDPPSITWNTPLNTYTVDTFNTYTFDIDVTDNYIECSGLYINLSGVEKFSNVSCDITSPYNIADTVDFTSWGDGNYSIEVCANDTATASPKIPHYDPTVKSDEIDFKDQKSKVDVTMKFELLDSKDKVLSNEGKDLELVAINDGKHIIYGGTINKLNVGEQIRFVYSSNNNNKFIMRNSNLPCHFTIMNKYYHHKTLIDKGWTIKQCEIVKGDVHVVAYKNSYLGKELKTDFDPMSGQVNSICEISYLYRDTNHPGFSNNQTNMSATTPKYLDTVQLNITITDNLGIDYYVLAHNDSGTMTNTTFRKGNGISYVVIENVSIATLKGNNILGWQVWANDSAGNENVSDIYTLEIRNTAPVQPTILYPVDDENYTTMIKINFTTTDVDDDSITYYIYINNTLNITTATNITTWNASDNSYSLKISAYDGTDFSSNASIQFRIYTETTTSSSDSSGGGGGGGGGGTVTSVPPTKKVSLVDYDIVIRGVKQAYMQGDIIVANISILNLGQTMDKNALLVYYLLSPENEKIGRVETPIGDLPAVCPNGTYNVDTNICTLDDGTEIKIDGYVVPTSITLPEEAEKGEWRYYVEYMSNFQPLIKIHSEFKVRDTFDMYVLPVIILLGIVFILTRKVK